MNVTVHHTRLWSHLAEVIANGFDHLPDVEKPQVIVQCLRSVDHAGAWAVFSHWLQSLSPAHLIDAQTMIATLTHDEALSP